MARTRAQKNVQQQAPQAEAAEVVRFTRQRRCAKAKSAAGVGNLRRSLSTPNINSEEEIFFDEPDIGKTLHAKVEKV